MQMYRGLPIVTNKISVEEQRGIPHHLLGRIGLEEEPWAAYAFKMEATKIIRDIRSRGKIPIVVGGTQYYVDALVFEDRLVEAEATGSADGDEAAESASEHPILDGPTDEMYARLKEVDPVMAARWHPNDRRKIRRSLQIYLTTGKRASDIYADQQKQFQSRAAAISPDAWQSLLLWVYTKPEDLEKRLFSRVEKMIDSGLLQETQEMYDYLQDRMAGGDAIDRTKGIWQSIGFKQLEPYLDGLRRRLGPAELEKLKQAGVEDLKVANRRYAKDQLRWIRKKTMPLVLNEQALDYLYLLDSSDRSRWSEDVAEKAAAVANSFLAGGEMASPADLSDTAREVLAVMVETSGGDTSQRCHRTCDVCQTTMLTERAWEAHIKSHRHKRATDRKRRTSLVTADRTDESKARTVKTSAPQVPDEEQLADLGSLYTAGT